ncbi:MAG: hypothetical protein HRF50_11115 [Phycisphaerae bacterium]
MQATIITPERRVLSVARRSADRVAAVFAVSFGMLLAGGCERTPADSAAGVPAPSEAHSPATPLPEHRFAEGLASRYPEVVAFLRHFMQTCLNGDYVGYRSLVSRDETPVSRDRFDAIYQAVRTVLVETIRPLDVRTPENETVYLVVSRVEVDPQSRVAVRHREPELAILVFREAGAWRMRPAPRELLKPGDGSAAESAPATTSAPTYPWEETGDP